MRRPGPVNGRKPTGQRHKPSSDPDAPLSTREAIFVAEYIKDLHGTRAAIVAGYAKSHAHVQSSRFLSKPKIQAAIQEASQARLSRLNLQGDDVLRELLRVGMSDVADAFDANGNLLPIKQMPIELRRCVSSMEVIIKNAAAGDGHQDVVHKIRFWDKIQALQTLAKHLGLLTEKVQVDGNVELTWTL